MTKPLSLLTTEQVCERLQVSRWTLQRWVKAGLLRACRPRGIKSRVVRFRERDVEELLQRR